MITVKPFKGYRPAENLVEKVAALPYDVMNSREAREMVKDNPYSFLHVDKAEIDLDESVDIHDASVYLKAKENLEDMIKKGVYVQDKQESFYIYALTFKGREQTGLVATVWVDDYVEDRVKKHEHTLQAKEVDRTTHIDVTNFQTGPIFLTYKDSPQIVKIIEDFRNQNQPVYDFVSEEGVGQRVWPISDPDLVKELVDEFAKLDNLYIADGHHRAKSAINVALQRRKANPNFTGKEEYNYFLAVIFPKSELYIMDYNRVVKDLNGLSEEEFLKKIEDKFVVEKAKGLCGPKNPKEFGMLLQNSGWFKLTAKDGSYNKSNIIESLDVAILQNNLLDPILGVKDPRKDSRIEFIGGIRGLKELEKRVNEDMAVAFAMYPTSIDELIKVADNNTVMPPKSTWFEPKLYSGLFLHELK